MTPISPIDFNIYCSKVSTQLLDRAIRQGKLPSRPAHIVTIVTTGIQEPFSLIKRVYRLAINTINLILSPLFFIRSKDGQGLRFLSLSSYVFVLSPLDLLNGVVTSVIRVASSVLGILSPTLAARGWQLAEKLDFLILKLADSLLKKIDYPKSSSSFSYLRVRPNSAIKYLGKEVCLSLMPRNAANENKLREDFSTYLRFLFSKCPNIIRKNPLLRTCISETAFERLNDPTIESEEFVRRASNELTTDEIHLLLCLLDMASAQETIQTAEYYNLHNNVSSSLSNVVGFGRYNVAV